MSGMREAAPRGGSDETGLDLLGARYYVPALGRFLTRDPIGHAGGLNLYRYCENNPLTKVDPDGKQAEDSVTATVQQQVARAATQPRDAIQFLREMMREVPNAANRNTVRNGLRSIFNLRGLNDANRIGHTLKHARDFFGLASRDMLSARQIEVWRTVIATGAASKNIFESSIGGVPTISWVNRFQGIPVQIHMYAEGPMAGRLASAFQVTPAVERVLKEAARQFMSGN